MQQAQSSHSKYLQQNLLTALSFSQSGQFCCLATKLKLGLRVYRVKDLSNIDSWQFLQEMHDHAQTISDVDWAKDDKIISGSHDRSVFIYKRVGDQKWQKMLVNIDIKLSILCVKWAPSAKKFALGASCNSLAIGFYNVESQCWTVTFRDKLCTAPIISLSFHPSSSLVAIGSADRSVRIVTCSFKNSKDDMIKKSNIEDASYRGPFEKIQSLFEVLFEIENLGGWINHVSFELNGSFLLVLPHSNHLKIYDVHESGDKLTAKEIDIKWNGLPFLSGYISDKGIFYAGGYDKKVAAFNRSSNGFDFAKFLDANQKSQVQKSTRGLVSERLSGLEKKAVSLVSQGPNPDQHFNYINILPSPTKKYVVSYDINGVIHFWSI